MKLVTSHQLVCLSICFMQQLQQEKTESLSVTIQITKVLVMRLYCHGRRTLLWTYFWTKRM